MRRCSLFLLALSAFLAHGSALDAQVLAGIVRLAPSGAPAAHTIVVAVGDSSRIVAARQADSTGVFALELGRPGNYRLLFIRSGNESVSTPGFALDSTPYVEREFQIPGDSIDRGPVLLASQVDTPARAKMERGTPQYPDHLGRNAIRGSVRAMFIVDAKGDVEEKSVVVVGTTNEAFITPMMRAVRTSHYAPARKSGRPVRQLVVRTAHFGCPGDPYPGVTDDWVIQSMYPACLAGK